MTQPGRHSDPKGVYTTNNTAKKYTKLKLMVLKGEITKSKVTVGVFQQPLSASDGIARGKINKDRRDSNDAVN